MGEITSCIWWFGEKKSRRLLKWATSRWNLSMTVGKTYPYEQNSTNICCLWSKKSSIMNKDTETQPDHAGTSLLRGVLLVQLCEKRLVVWATNILRAFPEAVTFGCLHYRGCSGLSGVFTHCHRPNFCARYFMYMEHWQIVMAGLLQILSYCFLSPIYGTFS